MKQINIEKMRPILPEQFSMINKKIKGALKLNIAEEDKEILSIFSNILDQYLPTCFMQNFLDAFKKTNQLNNVRFDYLRFKINTSEPLYDSYAERDSVKSTVSFEFCGDRINDFVSASELRELDSFISNENAEQALLLVALENYLFNRSLLIVSKYGMDISDFGSSFVARCSCYYTEDDKEITRGDNK